MNDQKILKTKLVALLEDLLNISETAKESAKTVELDQARVGRLSRMDALQAQAMSIESNRRREVQISRIKAALNRIEGGEYGYCQECGEDINPKRLEFDPSTPLCITCASKQEN